MIRSESKHIHDSITLFHFDYRHLDNHNAPRPLARPFAHPVTYSRPRRQIKITVTISVALPSALDITPFSTALTNTQQDIFRSQGKLQPAQWSKARAQSEQKPIKECFKEQEWCQTGTTVQR